MAEKEISLLFLFLFVKKLKIYYEFYSKSMEIFILLWYTYIEFLYQKAKNQYFENSICRKKAFTVIERQLPKCQKQQKE